VKIVGCSKIEVILKDKKLNKNIMKKVIRLTETDLTRIVKRVIKESNELTEIPD
jgi:phosphoribosyl-ATP pyrophosphohydrolase